MLSALNVANGQFNRASSESFPDPFMDIASMSFPSTIREAFCWVDRILHKNGQYRAALSRVVSYFVTDIEVRSTQGKDVGDDEKQKWEDYLHDVIGIQGKLQEIGLDAVSYGNSLTSILMPFTRYLSCPECRAEQPLRLMWDRPEFRLSWQNYEFVGYCPHCSNRATWNHVDRQTQDPAALLVKRWTPYEISIDYDYYTGACKYIWRIPSRYRADIRRGHRMTLENANWEFIQAVKANCDLEFHPDAVYHIKESTLAGVDHGGWGIPRTLVNASLAYYVQVLRRFNEAIALDYVVPFRVLSPQPRGPGQDGDPALTINMGGFTARMQSMLREHRRDPATWHVTPFPVQYQALGGDAKTLATPELIRMADEDLLNAIDVPPELYRGSLQLQTAPAALRLFEATWKHLVHQLNGFLQNVADQIAIKLSWEPVILRLSPVKTADDMNRHMAQLQLMTRGDISRTTGLKSVGVDFAEEVRRRIAEEKLEAEETNKAQKDMEQATLQEELSTPQGGGGAPPMPGMPPGGGAPPMPGMPPGAAGVPPGQPPTGQPTQAQAFAGSAPASPQQMMSLEEVNAAAEQYAQQLMMQPESLKDSMLIQLKRSNPVLHALTKVKMDELRKQQQLVGGAMLQQQQQQAAGQGVPVQ